ncbi:MAG TPA: DMT family transporter [Bacteroidetes bacterium]|nr:DMT family transporter [Bacteroidota bacterium]
MEQPKSFFKSHVALTAVALFYGINYFTLKTVFEEGYDSFAVLAIRCMVAVVVFYLFHRIWIREKIRSAKDFGRLFLCGMFGVSINQTFFLWGLAETSRVNAAVLMVTTPVFVFAVAAFLKQERITKRKILGLILSFAGALGLILSSSSESLHISGASIGGDLMIMANAASYGVYLVIVRPLIQKYNVFTIVKWIFLFGSIPNILLGMPALLRTDFSQMGSGVIFGIVFLILGATLGAYFLNAWAMKRVASSAVSAYVYLQPVLVTLISAILGLGEVTLLSIQFILLIFAGVYLVTMNRKAVQTTDS